MSLVPILLQLVVQISIDPEDIQNSPAIMGSILTTLTNLSLNDANNVKIRLHGAHIIGKILMEHCPRINEGEEAKQYFNDPQENVKI